MNECGVCKSKIKSLLYCNGCFQRAKSVAEKRGRVQELKLIKKVWYDSKTLNGTFMDYFEKRLLELEE